MNGDEFYFYLFSSTLAAIQKNSMARPHSSSRQNLPKHLSHA
jgi:hypothetical protein